MTYDDTLLVFYIEVKNDGQDIQTGKSHTGQSWNGTYSVSPTR